MEEIKNEKSTLTTDELKDVSGGYFVVEKTNFALNDSHAMQQNPNQAVEKPAAPWFYFFDRFFSKLDLKRTFKSPEAPSNGGNGGR